MNEETNTAATGMGDAGAVRAMAEVLRDAWNKAEPAHPATLHPASYLATFTDMAKAALAAQPAPVASGGFHILTCQRCGVHAGSYEPIAIKACHKCGSDMLPDEAQPAPVVGGLEYTVREIRRLLNGDIRASLTDTANGIDSPASCSMAAHANVNLDRIIDKLESLLSARPGGNNGSTIHNVNASDEG